MSQKPPYAPCAERHPMPDVTDRRCLRERGHHGRHRNGLVWWSDRQSAPSAPSRLCRLCGAFAAAGECIDVEACRLRRDSAGSDLTPPAPDGER